MPFGPVDPQLDLVSLEQRVLNRWRGIALAEQVKRLRDGASPWVFYEGPPTANGRPGLHHVWARAFKDLFPRFQTMRGHDVPRKGGWDCHGLPVEIEVEKELGFTRKSEIEAYGVANFNDRCRESVQRYVEDWGALTERAGVWIDTKNAYWTLTNDYIESVWWLVQQLFDAGLLYEGHRVTPYCPRCGTALSSHELGQPGAYRDVTDPSVYVRFPVVDRDVDLLVWTTTPWTLISNVAAAVGADIEYVRVHAPDDEGRDLVMAASRAPEDAVVTERYGGSELVGWRYERPFTFLPLDDRGARVVAASFVSTDDGSGIVHLAPAFGADDMDVGRAENLPVLNPVGGDGTFDATVPPWAGVGVRDANPQVIADLSARGLLVREEAYVHSYPHCWRCGTPLLYWAKTSWFVRTSERKGDLLRENERVDWHPAHIKHGRFGDWLENNVDWALSRDRYWGTPLPIWRCPEGHDTCIGSVAELEERSGQDLSALDLHRPYVDDVGFPCPAHGCGAPARRLPPVLDAWFDSGSMPSAQHHHPFGETGAFESSFPADFICEAIDQTRGWFYSLLAVNTLVFGSTPYRNVVCLAHIVDQYGQKMSKSKGNVIDPWQVFADHGADALRWYFFSAGSPWTSRRVYEDGIREATRKTLLTFWNVYSFFATYADIDGWQPELVQAPGAAAGHVMDRWVLGRLDQTVATVTTALDGFDALAAATAIAGFVDDLSNWYVRRSRPRFWSAADEPAHGVLHRCLVVTAQLLAPFCPFLADEVYVSLTGEESVHLTDWPAPAGAPPVAGMEAARRLVGLGRSARTDAGLGVRQPLRRALLLHPGVTLGDDIRAEIRDELNVKALEDVESLTDLMSWTVVPNFRALGPRLGPRVNEVKAALASADGATLRRSLEADGFVEVAGHRLGPDDVEVRAGSHDDYALSSDEGWAVALDLELDDDLEREGVARQLARELNDLRKRLQLALTDRVRIRIESGPRVAAAVEAHRDWIAAQVLATELAVVADAGPGAAHLEVAGEPVRVDLRVAT
ncbi:MAG: isoleucine--tRNA ligase [Actinomycetota bacterium]|nr:isoleucine--tRNA ligase [Actinomycetota bacterium]